MQVYFDYKKVPQLDGSVVTLGNFDGFHRGHRSIVDHTVSLAKKQGLSSVVVTFHPHPRQLFSGDLAVITPLERKVALLGEAGVDIILVQPFTKEFASTDPGVFIKDILQGSLSCQHVVVGYDYAFGKGGAGDTKFMELETGRLGIKSDVMPPVLMKDIIISSTVIRKFLAQGKVDMAAELMGRLYMVRGRVLQGAGRGTKLGFPTANIYPPAWIALPAFGVYLVEVKVKDQFYHGLANVGCHPTFYDKRISIEALLFEFQGNLYGEQLDIRFLEQLREERKFPDSDALTFQIAADVKRAKALLEKDNMLKLQSV